MVIAELQDAPNGDFCVAPQGKILVRPRESGDSLQTAGGTKSLKKLFIDRKIPEHLRMQIPVVADEKGVLGVYGIGGNRGRMVSEGPCVKIRFEKINSTEAVCKK